MKTDETKKNINEKTNVNQTDMSNKNLLFSKTLKFLNMLFLVLAFSGLYYLWNLEKKQNEDVDNRIKKLEKQTLTKEKKLESLSEDQLVIMTQQQDDKKTIETTKKEITKKIELLEEKLLTIQHHVDEDPIEVKEEIAINEINFLIQEASVYYALNKNQNITRKLLKLALNRVKTVQRSETIDLIKAIKKDLMNINIIDKDKMSEQYIALGLLIKNLSDWPDKTLIVEESEQGQHKAEQLETTQKEQQKTESWINHLEKSTTRVVTKWFQVVHHKEKVSPLLSSAESVYAKRMLKLSLQEAQWALIQNQQKLYDEILYNIKNEIKNTFNQQDKKVKNALVMIEGLIIDTLNVKPADQLASEKAIRIFISKISKKKDKIKAEP